MPAKVSVFLDTSALFAGIWSATGGGRMILKLGEAGAIRLLVCPQVLDEIESALRRKAPDMHCKWSDGPWSLVKWSRRSR